MSLNNLVLKLPCDSTNDYDWNSLYSALTNKFNTFDDVAKMLKRIPNSKFFSFKSANPTYLEEFLNFFCDTEEQNVFFKQILPFVVDNAVLLPKLLSESEIKHTPFTLHNGNIFKAPATHPLPHHQISVENSTVSCPSIPLLCQHPQQKASTSQSPQAQFATTIISLPRTLAFCFLTHLFLSSFPGRQKDHPHAACSEHASLPEFHFSTMLGGRYSGGRVRLPGHENRLSFMHPYLDGAAEDTLLRVPVPVTSAPLDLGGVVATKIPAVFAAKLNCFLHYLSWMCAKRVFSGEIRVTRRALLSFPDWRLLTPSGLSSLSMAANTSTPPAQTASDSSSASATPSSSSSSSSSSSPAAAAPVTTASTITPPPISLCPVVFTHLAIDEDEASARASSPRIGSRGGGREKAGGAEAAADEGYYCVDFANRFVGGGALDNGSMQEEVLFAAAPELLIACLFCEAMNENEAVLIEGAPQVSKVVGDEFGMQYAGDEPKKTIAKYIAMDATDFRGRQSSQFQKEAVLREVNKAYVAFSFVPHGGKIATGHWGCGTSRGDAVLKFLEQWIAASLCGVKYLRYSAVGGSSSPDFLEHAVALVDVLSGGLNRWTVEDVLHPERQASLDDASAAAAAAPTRTGTGSGSRTDRRRSPITSSRSKSPTSGGSGGGRGGFEDEEEDYSVIFQREVQQILQDLRARRASARAERHARAVAEAERKRELAEKEGRTAINVPVTETQRTSGVYVGELYAALVDYAEPRKEKEKEKEKEKRQQKAELDGGSLAAYLLGKFE